MIFSKKKLNFFFDPEKVKKRASKVAHNRPRPLYFTVQPRPTANNPELILHIEKSRDQRSVLLSVNRIISKSARVIPKILFILGLSKFLAYLECIRSYAWSFGHSDPDLSTDELLSNLYNFLLLAIFLEEKY